MIVDIAVPELGESISQVEIGEWLVEIGHTVARDQEVVEVDSDKATVEVPAPEGGVLVEILKRRGESAEVGEVVGRIDTEKAASTPVEPAKEAPAQNDEKSPGRETEKDAGKAVTAEGEDSAKEPRQQERRKVMPAAARILAQHDIDPQSIAGTGPGGRIVKEDALKAVSSKKTKGKTKEKAQSATQSSGEPATRGVRRDRMSPIRRTIASRLLEAKQNMALLTTFNEADMSEVKLLRKTFGEEFAEKYGVRLGFMSFFVKASVAALLDFPVVNAQIDGDDIVYHDCCDIGVAIGGGKGLVVPVLRQAEQMSFAEIEKKIAEFADKAKNNALSLKELEGGTFTISNGGIYGSMLSTPIVNPPQSAILGLHAIKDRPVAINGEVKIRPVMYLAMSYDHRIIDGREAVSFLKSIKERVEQPQKFLLEV